MRNIINKIIKNRHNQREVYASLEALAEPYLLERVTTE